MDPKPSLCGPPLCSPPTADLLFSLSFIHHFYRDNYESNKYKLDILCPWLTFLIFPMPFLGILSSISNKMYIILINLSNPTQNCFFYSIYDTSIFSSDPDSDDNYNIGINLSTSNVSPTYFTCKNACLDRISYYSHFTYEGWRCSGTCKWLLSCNLCI